MRPAGTRDPLPGKVHGLRYQPWFISNEGVRMEQTDLGHEPQTVEEDTPSRAEITLNEVGIQASHYSVP